MYETTIFKTTKRWAVEDREARGQKTNEVSPTIAPAYYSEMVSGQQHREKESRQNLVDSLS